MRRLALTCLLLTVATACGKRLDQKVEELVNAKNRWVAHCPIDNYSFTYEATGQHWSVKGTHTAKVDANTIVAIDGEPVSHTDMPTIRGMFDLILDSLRLENPDFAVKVQYDPVFGYPLRFELLSTKGGDTGARYEISSVTGCGA
jgi:hypothetical protein